MKTMNVTRLTKLAMFLLSCSIVADLNSMRPAPAVRSAARSTEHGKKLRHTAGDRALEIRGRALLPSYAQVAKRRRPGIPVIPSLSRDEGRAMRSTPAVIGSPEAKICTEAKSIDLGEQLCNAAEKGEVDRLRALIAAKAPVNYQDRYEQTPLHAAALFRHLDCINSLIAAGADVNKKGFRNRTPLHEAAAGCLYGSCVQVLQVLIDAKASVNAEDELGTTALHRAMFNNCKNCIKLLLIAGAVPNFGPHARRAEIQDRINQCFKELDSKRQEDVFTTLQHDTPALHGYTLDLLRIISSFESFEPAVGPVVAIAAASSSAVVAS